jgi:hypothetical protein
MGIVPVTTARALGPLAGALVLLTGCQSIQPLPTMGGGWAFVLPQAEAPVAPASPSVPVDTAGRNPASNTEGPAAPVPPVPPGGSGGGTGGGGAPAGPAGPVATGSVLDEAGLPVVGASVLFADGHRATTDAEGRYPLPGAFAPGAVIVSKSGYATSVVMGLDDFATLHLRRSDGRGEPYVLRKKVVTGIVKWPNNDHLGGAAYYVDDLGSISKPVLIAANGQFSVEVEPIRSGEPRGVVLVLAATSAPGETLMGVSRPFDTFGQDGPGEVAMHLADRAIAFQVDGVPANHPLVSSRLEVQQPDGPTVTIEGTSSLSGTLMAPPDGRLPGVTRLVVSARSADDQSGTRIAMVPAAGSPLRGTLLAPPSLALSGRTASWGAVPGAAGYRLSTQVRTAQVPAWEAWLPSQTGFTLPAEATPTDGPGEVLLEAVEAESLSSRRVASARQLRVEPWADTATHRVAFCRVAL